MYEANMLPIIFEMKTHIKKNINRLNSPVNKSLQIAISDFNSKMNEIKHKKVKEKRMKPINEIDLMNFKPFDVKNVIKSKSPSNGSHKLLSSQIIGSAKKNNFNSLEKSSSVEITSPIIKERDNLFTNKINILTEVKIEDNSDSSNFEQSSSPKQKEGKILNKQGVNYKLKNDESVFTNFYRAIQNNEVNIDQKKQKNINFLFDKENSFQNNISLAKRGKDENNLPILYPTVLLKDNIYHSESQKKRYEGICQQLSSLRYILEKGKTNSEYDLIKDFLKSHKITDPKYFSTDNLFKINQFIKVEGLPLPNETLENMISRIVSNEEDEIDSSRKKSYSHKLVKIKSTKNIKFLQNKLMNMKGDDSGLGMKMSSKFNMKTETDKELINRLENSLADAKEKVVFKKINRAKSKTRAKIVNREDIDSDFEEDDINGIKKNNKLLELLQRAKKKYLLTEGLGNII